VRQTVERGVYPILGVDAGDFRPARHRAFDLLAPVHPKSAMMGLVLLATSLLANGAAEKKPAPAENEEVAHYEKLAAQGDRRAMTELGLRYHTGRGAKQDYALAYDWYWKAMENDDGDAVNNIGVLIRDGLGVPKNPKVAYLLFLAVHMEGLGTDETQMRAGRNLSRLAQELPKADVEEALSYTWPYVIQIVKSRGKNTAVGADVLPAKDLPRIRDNGWWLDAERAQMTFVSPAPWDKAPPLDKPPKKNAAPPP
jgi:hypothetical protein